MFWVLEITKQRSNQIIITIFGPLSSNFVSKQCCNDQKVSAETLFGFGWNRNLADTGSSGRNWNWNTDFGRSLLSRTFPASDVNVKKVQFQTNSNFGLGHCHWRFINNKIAFQRVPRVEVINQIRKNVVCYQLYTCAAGKIRQTDVLKCEI